VADRGASHASHDAELIAGLLDGDLAGPELAAAQLMVVACPQCAALQADLIALSIATRAQPSPARPRDFLLTATDAARLRAEPDAANTRLTGDMTGPPSTSAHASHDATLVASLADHSLAASERSAAEALVATCAECASLRADLEILVAATRAMPTPPRPIDYTLTRGQAARLRPNPWRRLVAATGSTRDGITRPLAIGLTALGLVGLLVSSGPSVLQFPAGLGGSAASSPRGEAPPAIQAVPAPGAGLTDTTGGTEPGAALAPGGAGDTTAGSAAPERAAASAAPVYGVTSVGPIPGASGDALTDGSGKGAANGAVESPPAGETTAELTATAPSSGMALLPLVSAALLFVGLGLFILRWGARRLVDG
jgi:hypothetical protein